ncbi:NAD(P)/FAD-dependent oxidoreductase [Anaeromicropila populeti]|uniref:Sarcosine oxidase subunit beta n=1 Tax=Anaeromicropila populeti TaxID=37658 RepID=A0A1I6KYI0_9FIRM|nr:FAD-binding oxidoreductase [Anaeromicropila populeti]SFR96272.1 sarcosine oxidase subunit beta [Anaeromicropila populeti]
MNSSAEVLIIGGGVIGCATAYYLAKKGIEVIVLEKNQIGEGGSSRNGGGVRQSGRDPRELPLAMYAVEHLWPILSEELGMDVEYYKKGNLRLAKTPAHIKILEGLTSRAQAVGLKVQMIDGEEVRKINPHLSDEVIGASWCPTDGHANPMLTTLAYYKNARKAGARFITGEKVLELKKVKGRIRKVITDHSEYEAETVILAAGFESRKIANTIGIDIPMQRVLLEALVTEAQPKMFEQMLGTAEADFYGHQSTHGSFVFGGSSGMDAYTSDYDRPVTTSFTASCICRGIMKYFPELAEAKIVRTWSGWIDECADKVPVIDKVEEVPGLIVACGFTGHGFGICPAVGTVLSELAMGEQPSIDISGLKYGRFKAKI